MRYPCASWIVAAAISLTSCGGGGGGSTATAPPPPGGGGGGGGGGGNLTVVVGNNNYTPSSLNAAPGSTVTWQWDSCTGDGYGGQLCTSHSVTFDDGGPSAATRETGTFQRQFGAVGTYTYYCTTHGRTAMSGSVVVR
jgi:plastocyanin